MTTTFHPLMYLRISLLKYLDNPEEYSGELYNEAMAAILQMHDAMTNFMLSDKDNSILKRYMRTWQEQIRLLFDEIPYSWIENMDLNEQPNEADNVSDQKYNICFECFRLIKEMELAYPAFFDDSCIPPSLYLVLEKSRHHHNWALVSKWFNKRKEKYNTVWQLINSYLERIWDVNVRFSYKEIAYGFNFIDQLLHNIQKPGHTFNTKALYSFLIYLNFNDIGLLNNITNNIREDMEYTMTDVEKVAALEDLQQEFESALIRADCILDPGNPPITTMLSRWVKRELKALRS
ncbi:hypothetical protein [Chitinophaga sancti]|uniref:Uncharacterized protein n=1 Tax=Chitinophaga sancti TaxID=1004 RepID=A0A1K1T3B3_9BACT|nr:hypothetical protein [Chitinophaga sancti]WQD59621.1 hypothetical protein U0033_17170 [Chitinophaga sancti]WQG88248.1 hypothetical protein SR876_25295 [Chitinophaga sancti]SFW90557.1 hypothetical protein SAMN05661012_06634 [Chitinophaga sancti]